MSSSQASSTFDAMSPSVPIAPEMLVYQGKTWRQIPHEASRRRGTPVSQVWRLGKKYEDIEGEHGRRLWRCDLCNHDSLTFLGKNDNTSNPMRHLYEVHKMRKEEEERSRSATPSLTAVPIRTVSGLVDTLDIDAFRKHLLRWIVTRQQPFNEVEDVEFRAILTTLNKKVKTYIPGGNSIQRWVRDEFNEAIPVVAVYLKTVRSKIHFSFDLWTAPNQYAICGVTAHFLSRKWKNETLLLTMAQMKHTHTAEDIAPVLLRTIETYGIDPDQIGVYIADNVHANDNAIAIVLERLGSQDLPATRRGRCFGHIVNLIAQAFLFGNELKGIYEATNAVNENTAYDSVEMRRVLVEWRKKGPIGKLHNLIVNIRSSPQKREEFKRILTGVNSVDGKPNLFLSFNLHPRF